MMWHLHRIRAEVKSTKASIVRGYFVDNLYLLLGRLATGCFCSSFLRSLLIIHLIEIHLFTFTCTNNWRRARFDSSSLRFYFFIFFFHLTLALLSSVHSLKFHLYANDHIFIWICVLLMPLICRLLMFICFQYQWLQFGRE